MQAYFASEYRDETLVLDYANRLGNRAVYKRLGYLIEVLGISAPGVVATCRVRRSSGLVALDPTVTGRGRILRRWNLRVNATVEPTETFS